MKFTIEISRDSFFIGSFPHWIGLHLDAPWSFDVKEYGAPCRGYAHFGKKCFKFNLPFKSKELDPTTELDAVMRPQPVIWSRGRRRLIGCAVEGCLNRNDDEHGVFISNKSLRLNGVSHSIGSEHAFLCSEHTKILQDYIQWNNTAHLHENPAPEIYLKTTIVEHHREG